jgi:hypothetical protein
VALAIAMALEASVHDEILALVADSRDGSARDGMASNGLGAFAELGFGLLPGASAGIVLRGELGSVVTLRLDLLGHTSQNQRLTAGSARFDVDAWLAGARVAACLPVALSRALLVRTCAGLGAGGLLITGRGAGSVRSTWLPWFDVSAGAELSVMLSEHWSIDAGGNLELPLGERSFGVSNSDGTLAAVRPLPDVAASLRAGPAYHF